MEICCYNFSQSFYFILYTLYDSAFSIVASLLFRMKVRRLRHWILVLGRFSFRNAITWFHRVVRNVGPTYTRLRGPTKRLMYSWPLSSTQAFESPFTPSVSSHVAWSSVPQLTFLCTYDITDAKSKNLSNAKIRHANILQILLYNTIWIIILCCSRVVRFYIQKIYWIITFLIFNK